MSLNKKMGKGVTSIILSVILVVSMMVMAVVPASAEVNDAVREDANGVFVITSTIHATGKLGDVKFENEPVGFYQGSSFMINTNTVLTCAHCVDPERIKDEMADIGLKVNDIVYEIILNKDVTVTCALKKFSAADDYAILTLNEPIAGKSILKLGDSDAAVPTQSVFVLGFPALVTEFQQLMDVSNQSFDKDDVTFTEGEIQKLTSINNTDVIQHGCLTSKGVSGGPLVDANGNVLGVHKWKYDKKTYDQYGNLVNDDNDDNTTLQYATAINEVKKVLDSLMIEYTDADAPAPVPTEDEEAKETTEEVEESTEVAESVVAPVTEPTTAPADDESASTKNIIIIAIIALAVILIAVVVVIIIVSTKKKKNGPKNGPQGGPVMPPTTPQAPKTPQRPNTPYAQPYSRPQMPPQGAAPTMPSNDGVGETSVLNEGAGETTVLGGNQATGFALLRKANNERININKPEFTIGKERRRVDYCIENNNSVSRTHAKIRVRSGNCYIADLGSTNCTFVNGSKIAPNQEVALNKGDKIKISDEEFEVI